MKGKVFLFSIVLLAAVALSTTAVFAADMFTGTWKMNLAKSTYSPGPPPSPPKEPSIQKITAIPNGLKVVAASVNSAGEKTHNEFTVKFDGKDYPVTATLDGKPDPKVANMISGKKIDDYTMEFTLKLNGKVTSVNTNVVSKDGKVRTTTQTGTNAQGQAVNNTVIYEKQ